MNKHFKYAVLTSSACYFLTDSLNAARTSRYFQRRIDPDTIISQGDFTPCGPQDCIQHGKAITVN